MFSAGLGCVILLALLLWSGWFMLRRRPSDWRQTILFFLLVSFSLLLFRWPQMRWSHEIQVDESQMLAQGMRFFSHPIPWRDVDGMTGGPLDSMILAVPMFFGIPASWQMARVTLWLSNCLVLILLYLALRRFGTRAEAQFAMMPAVFFYALATHADFIHYSSETLPALLLAACLLHPQSTSQNINTARWLRYAAS